MGGNRWFLLGLFIILAVLLIDRIVNQVRVRNAERRVGDFFGSLADWQKKVQSPEHKLEQARKAMQKLREGDTMPKFALFSVDEALRAGFKPEDFDSTPEEVEEFRRGKSYLIYAQKLLQKYRNEGMGLTDYIVELARKGGYALKDIPTDQAELDRIDREEIKHLHGIYPLERLQRYAQGDGSAIFQDSIEYEYKKIVNAVEGEEERKHNFSFEEFGTTRVKLDGIYRSALLQRAGYRLEALRGYMRNNEKVGVYAFDLLVKDLEKARDLELPRKDRVEPSEIGSSDEEMEKIRIWVREIRGDK